MILLDRNCLISVLVHSLTKTAVSCCSKCYIYAHELKLQSHVAVKFIYWNIKCGSLLYFRCKRGTACPAALRFLSLCPYPVSSRGACSVHNNCILYTYYVRRRFWAVVTHNYIDSYGVLFVSKLMYGEFINIKITYYSMLPF